MPFSLKEIEFRYKAHQYDAGKRVFDLVISLCLLICLSPVIALVALAVLWSSGRPVIFTQKRLTKGEQVFTMYKFRTMKQDAETKTGAVWAQVNDPRVTRIGSFLRMTRLDELPQLINVIHGEMSLIGPRPERPEIAKELEKQLPSFNKRLEVKAGLTGLAQINKGYASCIDSYRKKLALDLLYIKKRGFLLDIYISFKTILVVLTGSGAR